MTEAIYELKHSLKELNRNLIKRIDPICEILESKEDKERLSYWLDDLTILTETTIVLNEKKVTDFDLNLFNEKINDLLDGIENKDFLLVSDQLQYELKPLLTYWDECIKND
ncbi:hypothetical protein [Fictibacillus sp. 18YEL24]|uniref:hypothetical protein n=1 Tax=Fictibacillus sp. 18YEL24 TaxID=2745875 RepID=UPI0018CF2914|nr:hypothetical protein [Fictibacillus sp. 18YEL24]MBH0169358.1 hypothetical protein [Fictibacillus sp. 18YEL24]